MASFCVLNLAVILSGLTLRKICPLLISAAVPEKILEMQLWLHEVLSKPGLVVQHIIVDKYFIV
jgi:hypothetical protein